MRRVAEIQPRQLINTPKKHRSATKWRRAAMIDRDRSDLVLQETALFLYQLQYESRMQQAMHFDAYDVARKLRARRDEVDTLLEKFQNSKGDRSGATSVSSEYMDMTTKGLSLRAELSKAIDEERYDEAARIRDALKSLNQETGDVALPSKEILAFRLGHIVKHNLLNYRGVICGWDLGCCESNPWKERNTIDDLTHGDIQPFYHILVDEREWPAYTRGPPMAYVAQEMLELIEASDVHDFNKIRHPFLISMFLGTDNSGFYIPCKPLRNKYRIEREDSHPPQEDHD